MHTNANERTMIRIISSNFPLYLSYTTETRETNHDTGKGTYLARFGGSKTPSPDSRRSLPLRTFGDNSHVHFFEAVHGDQSVILPSIRSGPDRLADRCTKTPSNGSQLPDEGFGDAIQALYAPWPTTCGVGSRGERPLVKLRCFKDWSALPKGPVFSKNTD